MRKLILIALLFISAFASAQTTPTTAPPANPQQMTTNTVYQDAITKKYYVYNGSTFLWRQLTDSLQVKRMIAAGTGITSITPGIGFTSHTPITSIGTMNIDTINTILPKWQFLHGINTIRGNWAFTGANYEFGGLGSSVNFDGTSNFTGAINTSDNIFINGGYLAVAGTSSANRLSTDGSGNLDLYTGGGGGGHFTFNTSNGTIQDLAGVNFTKSGGTSLQYIKGDGTYGTYTGGSGTTIYTGNGSISTLRNITLTGSSGELFIGDTTNITGLDIVTNSAKKISVNISSQNDSTYNKHSNISLVDNKIQLTSNTIGGQTLQLVMGGGPGHDRMWVYDNQNHGLLSAGDYSAFQVANDSAYTTRKAVNILIGNYAAPALSLRQLKLITALPTPAGNRPVVGDSIVMAVEKGVKRVDSLAAAIGTNTTNITSNTTAIAGKQATLSGTGNVYSTAGTITYRTIIVNEVPTGTVNGVNTLFTTAHSPITGTFDLKYNGVSLRPTTDYSISGTTITTTFAPSSTSGSGSLLITYNY